ncbi:MAG: GNAT family N-acetyltransferase [Chloroflexi bacterium]|nr:GNAT family N-acetyltransferase [Chloroflexota bacterium]
MCISIRQYKPDDFETIGNFLIENHQPGNRDGNWLQPTWEYMHSHPYLDETSLGKIAIWEDDGKIVGVVHYESVLGEAFFEIHRDYVYLKSEMLDHAERCLWRQMENGEHSLRVFVNDWDTEFESLVKSRGYELDAQHNRPLAQLAITQPFRPDLRVPDGFQIKSLADENNLLKVQRVMWRGFNHPGEPPANELDGQVKMQSVPHFRQDLKIVVQAPNGDFVSFCGMWYESTNKIAYVEPVATDPDFRRMGLGKAAVLEGIRRCGELGATVAYVGSDQLFYQALGFQVIFTSNCWRKNL